MGYICQARCTPLAPTNISNLLGGEIMVLLAVVLQGQRCCCLQTKDMHEVFAKHCKRAVETHTHMNMHTSHSSSNQPYL